MDPVGAKRSGCGPRPETSRWKPFARFAAITSYRTRRRNPTGFASSPMKPIEQVISGRSTPEHLSLGKPYSFRLVTVPLRNLDDAGLEKLSRDGQLSLNLAEMRAIQGHFRESGPRPDRRGTRNAAQTWSEHCSHKTLRGQIDFDGQAHRKPPQRNHLRGHAGNSPRLGPDDWCVSVFEDNAGVVRFNDDFTFASRWKRTTIPRRSSLTAGRTPGLGGVIRDPLGHRPGREADLQHRRLLLRPARYAAGQVARRAFCIRRGMQGVVAGVRDYGNRMGIPTVNGAVCFDQRYLGNPLVYCGTVG